MQPRPPPLRSRPLCRASRKRNRNRGRRMPGAPLPRAPPRPRRSSRLPRRAESSSREHSVRAATSDAPPARASRRRAPGRAQSTARRESPAAKPPRAKALTTVASGSSRSPLRREPSGMRMCAREVSLGNRRARPCPRSSRDERLPAMPKSLPALRADEAGHGERHDGSPGANARTSRPTATTTPATSCPRTVPAFPRRTSREGRTADPRGPHPDHRVAGPASGGGISMTATRPSSPIPDGSHAPPPGGTTSDPRPRRLQFKKRGSSARSRPDRRGSDQRPRTPEGRALPRFFRRRRNDR